MGQAIILLSCGFLHLLLSFFPRLISAVGDWMSAILLHMVWPCANVECRSEVCCTRLAGNAGPKNIAKNSPSGHHRTTLSGYIFATEARRPIDNRKKIVKQQYLPHMSSQYGELRPTSDWDLLASLGHPSKFQQVSRLGSVTARHSSSGSQPECATLNRGRHLHSAGRPSRWALAHNDSS